MTDCCEKGKEWVQDGYLLEFKLRYDDSEFVEINYCPWCGELIKKD